MNRYHLLVPVWFALSSCLFALWGCTSNKAIVRLAPKAPELYSKKSLAQVLKNSPSPKIVLRVPATTNRTENRQQATGKPNDTASNSLSETERVACNAIEKQLFRSGFTVRDRALFNEVMPKSGNIDYTTVNSLTDTDLILELVQFNTRIPYVTDKYFQKAKKGDVERTLSDPKKSLTLYGGLVEFKLIHVRTNEVVGTYLFNYVPCLEGCPYELQSDGTLASASVAGKPRSDEQAKPDYVERFMTRATQQLVQAIKQTPAAVSRTN